MSVNLSKKAVKSFNHLPELVQKKVRKQLNLLEKNKIIGKKLHGDLKNKYSIRVWPYRIIYQIINKEKWVIDILHRQGVYK
jgi:mRNA-degrading endonuclease RelE of RelBE toxin-antitoxin system